MKKKIGIGILVVVGLLALFFVWKRDNTFYERIPDGYEKVTSGFWTRFNNTRVSGAELLELAMDHGLEEIHLLKRGKFHSQKISYSEDGLEILAYEKQYWCIVVSKQGVVKGFVLQEVKE